MSAVLVAASVIRAYWQSSLGKAITGSEMSYFLRLLKASIAASGKGPPLYPESFRVSLNNGATMTAKSFMCVLKKL